MTLSCQNVAQSDPQAAELCAQLSAELSLSPAQFDRGTCRVDYSASGNMPICEGSDSNLSAAEIYQAFLKIAPTATTTPQATASFVKKFGTTVTWAPDISHEALAQQLVTQVQTNAAAANDTTPYGLASELLKTLRSHHFRYADHTHKEADINQALDRHFVRCSEFQTLFFGIGKKLGLKMYPIEVPQVGPDGKDAPHGAIMIVDETTGKRYFADFQFETILKSSPYEEYYVGTETDLLAGFLHNRSLKKSHHGMTPSLSQETPLKLAELIAPKNDMVLFGLAVYHNKRHESAQAGRYLQRTIDARPTHVPALRAYCLQTFDMDICDRIP